MTRRDLETIKQQPKESFSTFITKWRAKAAQMITRPSEEEQIQMVVKNLLPIFRKHLFAQYFQNFKALIIASTQVEDAINNGKLKNEKGSIFEKVVTHTTNEEAINVLVPQTSSIVNSRPRRKFNELHMPMSQLFEKLILERLLGPLESQPPPFPLPKGYKSHEFYKYHQEPGHQRDKCINLWHAIQNLIDQQVITPPSSANNPDFVWFYFASFFRLTLWFIVYLGFTS